MARTLDPDAHAQRRQAFLEVAAQVIERKGYEGMTIQDILNTMQASKGAFYHLAVIPICRCRGGAGGAGRWWR